MELRQLEYFVAVAEERSFTRGAARTHVVQSAISAGIKSLEQELGTALLDRSTKRVDLTEAGSALLAQARRTLQAAADARDAVDSVRGGLRGTVRIGTMTSVGLIDLAAVLGRFHALHPGITAQLTAAPSGSQGLVEAIVDRRLDLALVSMPSPPHAPVTLFDLARAPIDFIVPGDHPLAQRDAVRLRDLTDLSFIDSPVGYGNRTVVDRAFAAAGLSRLVAMEVPDIATVSDFVGYGLGVAFVPRFAIPLTTRVTAVRVSDADLMWPMSLATPSDRRIGPAAAALVELIRDAARPA
jgi:DNA-binding transcriptional LysR family regulator